MNRLSDWSNTLLWVIYLALLAVLLPHTAWAFSRFEPQTAGWLGIPWGIVTAWAAAFAFEAAIAALTHRLARRIEHTPRYTAGHVLLRRFCFQYVNAYATGLFVALGVSALANFARAVEYSQAFAIFGRYNVPPLLYSLMFGAILAAPDDATFLTVPRSAQATDALLPGWFGSRTGLTVGQRDLQELWLPPARPVPYAPESGAERNRVRAESFSPLSNPSAASTLAPTIYFPSALPS